MAASNGTGQGEEREREEFTRAYRRHAGELYRFCLSRTGDATNAEEALATVFLEAWRRHGDVDFTSRPIRPWLYGVARNVLRNQWRAQNRRDAIARSLGYVNQTYAEDPSDELARRDAANALIGSLGTLPLEQRQVVSLCLLGDSSYEAAANDLKVPVGTVRSRLSRARLHLALAIRAADGL